MTASVMTASAIAYSARSWPFSSRTSFFMMVSMSFSFPGSPPGPVRCSSTGYAARRAPADAAGPLSAGMTATAHVPRRGGPGSEELLVTRQPERDDDLPLPCRPVGVAVEDLPPGDPELIL